MSRVVLFTMLASSLALAATPQRAVAPGRNLAPQQDKLQRALRQALPSRIQRLAPAQPHVLPALDNNQLRRNASRIGDRQVGVHRRLDPVVMQDARRDGSTWRIAIQSPGATGMRLHFTNFAVSGGQVWIHDGTGEEETIFGPYTERGPNQDGEFWSDVIFADTVTVEYQPAAGTGGNGAVPFTIEEISHQFEMVAAPSRGELASASCELDATCYADWAWTAKATARLSFEKPDGSFVCSGALLNTRNSSFVPYFLTANHCISTDAVARTLQAIWFYQKDTCNGATPSRNFPRTLGATVVATGDVTKSDFTLLKLSSVPEGVTYMGWDPRELAVGTALTVIHHPGGDYKRIAFGKIAVDGLISDKFYPAILSSGIVEGGSSGSGVYSAPGVLVGTLSTAPKVDSTEAYCRKVPFEATFGKFSNIYPQISQYLEDRTSGGSSTPPPGTTTNTLTSGITKEFTLAASAITALFNGRNGFSINVPAGATRLEINLRTITANADVDLYVRFGQDIALSSGNTVMDVSSQGPTGSENIILTPTSTPALRAGTYYIALGLFTRNTNVQGTIKATVVTGGTPPPSSTGIALTSGAATNFSLPPLNDDKLFNGGQGFRIDVPEGATQLEVKLSSRTPNVDLDLYVSFDDDPVLDGTKVIADYASRGLAAAESVVVTTSSNPPLRAGRYYIAIGAFTKGVAIDATITATVTMHGTPPPPSSNTRALTSGVRTTFTLPPVNDTKLFNEDKSYTISVPQGATRLEIVVQTQTLHADVDIHARLNRDVEMSEEGEEIADFSADSAGGDERIVIDASSTPPLRPGTYYIALALYTLNREVTGTLTATVQTDSPTTPPPSRQTFLTSGARQILFYNPVSTPTLFNDTKSFIIDVPVNATRLDVLLAAVTPGADLDLHISYGKDNTSNNDDIVADFSADGPDGNERIVITPQSNPSLRPGRYYISVAVYTTRTNILAALVATITTGNSGGGGQSTPPSTTTTLTPGQQVKFSLPSVTSTTLYNGNYSYQIQVPAGKVWLEARLVSDNPNVDVDLYARYQSDVTVDGQGNIISDHHADGPTGNERLLISTATTQRLRAGTYYLSLVLFTKGAPATGTLVVTLGTDILDLKSSAGRALRPGIPEVYSLRSVDSPVLFAGSSAYRVSADSRHVALRVSANDDTPGTKTALFVRRGRQPEVIDGHVVADFSTSPGSHPELTIEGDALEPGVYYAALGLYSSGAAATGTITASLISRDGQFDEVELPQFGGMPIAPKPETEVLYALPDPEGGAPHLQIPVEKRLMRLKKREPVRVEVSR